MKTKLLLIVFILAVTQYALLSNPDILNPSREDILYWLSALSIALSATLSFLLIGFTAKKLSSIVPLNRRSGGRVMKAVTVAYAEISVLVTMEYSSVLRQRLAVMSATPTRMLNRVFP